MMMRGTYYHIRLLNVLPSIFPVVLFVALWCSFHGQYFEIFVCLVTLEGNCKQCETICSGFALWQIFYFSKQGLDSMEKSRILGV